MRTIDTIVRALWPKPTEYTRELARKATLAVARSIEERFPDAAAALVAEAGTEPRQVRQNRLWPQRGER